MSLLYITLFSHKLHIYPMLLCLISIWRLITLLILWCTRFIKSHNLHLLTIQCNLCIWNFKRLLDTNILSHKLHLRLWMVNWYWKHLSSISLLYFPLFKWGLMSLVYITHKKILYVIVLNLYLTPNHTFHIFLQKMFLLNC